MPFLRNKTKNKKQKLRTELQDETGLQNGFILFDVISAKAGIFQIIESWEIRNLNLNSFNKDEIWWIV